MISLTLENPLYLFADESTLYHDIPHPSEKQDAASSLSSDLDKIISCSNTWNMSLTPDKSHTLTLSFQKNYVANLPIDFLQNLLEKVQLLQRLGLTIVLSVLIFLGQTTFQSWPPKPEAPPR